MLDFSSLQPLVHRLDEVFSDLDGTLADNEGPALDTIGEVYFDAIKGRFNLNPQIMANGFGNIRQLAGIPPDTIRQILSKRAGTEIPVAANQEVLRRRKQSPVKGEVCEQIRPIVEFIKYFQQLGGRAMIVTSSERDRAERYVVATGLDQVFNLRHDLVSAHSDVGADRHKPHPDCYQLALDLRGAHYSRTITFEDSQNGTEAGVAAKIPVVGVLLGNHIAEDDKARKAEKLLEAGAQQVIQTVDDVVPVLRSVLQSLPPRHLAAPEYLVARPVGNNKLGPRLAALTVGK